MRFFKLQILDDDNRVNYVDEALSDNRITSNIEYAKEKYDTLVKGDIVLVHKGNAAHALVEVLYKISDEKEIVGISFGTDYRVKILDYFSNIRSIRKFATGKNKISFTGTFNELVNKESATYQFVYDWYSFRGNKNMQKSAKNLLLNKKQIILQGPPGTGKTRLAKKIANSISEEGSINLIQFHPSYTYEDFVRGIAVKSGDDGIEYITENKILAKIAKEAHQNYLDSKKESSEILKEKWLVEQFELFKESIEDEIENNGTYPLSANIGIQQIGKRYFKYVGNGWHDYIKYVDFLLLFETDTFDRQAIKKRLNIGSRSSYYAKLAEKFNIFLQTKTEPEQSNQKVELKNYVLIIDEINRANLSSVLGELIYALEYRGDPVESMYEMEDGGNTIILPKNLYIIGTMNTADRSVGQIDYAIRRRFAFVDVLPEVIDESTLDEGLKFEEDSFNKVRGLFVGEENYLSDEFKAKDVQLGHSYFIYNEKDGFDMNLEYEIKPILREYVSDGILKEAALKKIDNL